MQVGDLVLTSKGNLAIIIEKELTVGGYYFDVVFCKTSVVSTFHKREIQKVIKK